MTEIDAARARIAELEEGWKAASSRAAVARAECERLKKADDETMNLLHRMRPVVEAALDEADRIRGLTKEPTGLDRFMAAVDAYRAHPSPRDEEGK